MALPALSLAMTALIVLENPYAAVAVADYAGTHGWQPPDVVADCGEAARLVRFRRYPTVICDASFEGPSCTAGLEIARIAKRADPRTCTILLATWMSQAIQNARAAGEVDVVLLKPQPLSLLFSYAVRETIDETCADGTVCGVIDLQTRAWLPPNPR